MRQQQGYGLAEVPDGVPGMTSGPVRWPDEADEVIRGDLTAAAAYLTPRRGDGGHRGRSGGHSPGVMRARWVSPPR